MEGVNAVSAIEVTKSYGDVLAVEDVDLTVESGEVHGLIGPNGAGKTTVLSMLFGLTRPDRGSLRVLGRPARPAGRAPAGVGGFVETPAFYPYLSARRNLALLAGLDGRGAGPDVEDVLFRVGLAEVAGEKIRGFSLGMRQRLGIAAALQRDLRLLILDEPTNGLDPVGMREVRSLVRTLAAEGVAVLLSSHQIQDVEELCDAVTILRTGTVAFAGSLAQLRERAPQPEFLLHTSDDGAALALAGRVEGVDAAARCRGAGLVVRADRARLDEYIIELCLCKVAVRELYRASTPLESLFFELTADEQPASGSTSPDAELAGAET